MPVPGRQGGGNPERGGRPNEPQIQMTPVPVPAPRSVAPATGSMNDGGSSTRTLARRPAPHLENGAIITPRQYQAVSRTRQEVPRDVREFHTNRPDQPAQAALQQAHRDASVATPPRPLRNESLQHAKVQAEGMPR
ncbi:MAG: hypothetical protein ACMG6H_14700 [Acidobacteriota bacterium]